MTTVNFRGDSSDWRAISDDGPISERINNAAIGYLIRDFEAAAFSSSLHNKIESKTKNAERDGVPRAPTPPASAIGEFLRGVSFESIEEFLEIENQAKQTEPICAKALALEKEQRSKVAAHQQAEVQQAAEAQKAAEAQRQAESQKAAEAEDNEIENENPLRGISTLSVEIENDPPALWESTLDYMSGESEENLAPPSPPPKASQAETIPRQFIDQFTDDDVLLGRGGLTNHHPGNIRFRKEADKLKAWYYNVSKIEKYPYSKHLVQLVHSYGGRFLQKEQGTKSPERWYEVEEERARKKASQALRENKKTVKDKGQSSTQRKQKEKKRN